MNLGIDLGGTKIEAALLNNLNEVIWSCRTDTPSGNYELTLKRIFDLVNKAEVFSGMSLNLGICVPGSPSPLTGIHRNANSTCLNGKYFKKDLEAKLNREIKMENDANCLALSEAVDGVGENSDVVFGVILGTGCGGGLVINKKIINGHQGLAGEWGHISLPNRAPRDSIGRVCWCGKKDCIETYLSGPAIESEFAKLTGSHFSLKKIASSEELHSKLIIEYLVERLAASLSIVIGLLDPGCIVLGGGVSNIDSLAERVSSKLNKYVFSDQCNTLVVKSKYGDSSGVRGAAWLWEISKISI